MKQVIPPIYECRDDRVIFEIYSMAMAAKPDRHGLRAMPPILTWFDPHRT